ncbi:competence protein ComK [Sporosarcina sp. Te-1]|uniref:competence protein ComK n=1 Tax=Sporosarcina sp. Te-1 TaxID=2818390 RepID=UPI001A9FDA19|nr:competence protein ComK [Sporosarcina sp. Te-1]QTD40825.1 competence protein ComK [Sporosarcina sp. Te-1]
MKVNMLEVMNTETMAFVPNWNDDGSLSTVVVRTDGLQDVERTPTELMDAVLRYYGSSLRGAKDGARAILGEISMQPVLVSEKLGLYMFPSTSPANKGCIWFSLHHIDSYKMIDNKRIAVKLMNGSTITVETSLYSFDQKVKRASHLRCRLEGRPAYQVNETQVSYQINKEIEDRNYQFGEDNE